jgi:hypothetical protein
MLSFGTLDVENLVDTIINNPKLTSKAWKVTTRLARVGVPRMDQNMIPLSTPNMDHLFKSLDILDLFIYIYTFCVPESALRCQVMFPPSTPAPCPLATCCYGARCDRRKHPPCFFAGHGSTAAAARGKQMWQWEIETKTGHVAVLKRIPVPRALGEAMKFLAGGRPIGSVSCLDLATTLTTQPSNCKKS